MLLHFQKICSCTAMVLKCGANIMVYAIFVHYAEKPCRSLQELTTVKTPPILLLFQSTKHTHQNKGE